MVLQSAIGMFVLTGGSLGTAAFGAIFAAGLTAHLAEAFPGGLPTAVDTGVSPEVLARLPAEVRSIYVEGLATSLSTVFFIATFIAVGGFVLTWLVPEERLLTLLRRLGRLTKQIAMGGSESPGAGRGR